MNCQDISRILESRNVNELAAAERSDCEAHAMCCSQCGPEWVVYARLAAIRSPAMRPEFAAQCLALAATQERAQPGRANRMILLGTLFVVAAAAATLVWLSDPPQLPSEAVAVIDPVPIVVEEPASAAAAAESPATVASVPTLIEVQAAPKEVAATPFAVRMLPLQNEVIGATGRVAVISTYAAFLKQLRAVPGLTLLESGSTANVPEAQLTYEIRIGAVESGDDNKIPVTMQAESRKSDGTSRSNMVIQSALGITPDCVNNPQVSNSKAADSSCLNPEGIADLLVGFLRKSMFPRDTSMERQMQGNLIDRSLDEHRRRQALSDLVSVARTTRSGNSGNSATEELFRNPEVIGGAIDLASTATDARVRAAVWELLQGAGNAELIAPLLAALGRDPDSNVRLAALGTLSGDFSGDPRERAALETAAVRDARPLVRALAQRVTAGAAGDAAWKEYVLAALKDSSRPNMERIEALFIQMGLAATGGYRAGATAFNPDRTLNLLDSDSIKALAEVLPRAAADSTAVPVSASALVRALGSIENPAITDMLLASLQGRNSWLDRETAAQALAALPSRRDDARVHAALEKISATDPNPQLRQVASTALQVQPSLPASPAAAQTPPGLGVYAGPVQAAAYMPRELLGKALVNVVMPGSVGEGAGVRPGDVLLEIKGEPIASARDLYRILATIPAGTDVDVVVYRFGGKVMLKARF